MTNSKKNVNVKYVAGDVKIYESPEYQINSAISELLNILAKEPFKFKPLKRRPSAETIVKINYNNLKSKSHIIKQYLDYSSKVEQAYTEIDALVAFGKDTILRNLYDIYNLALDTVGIDHLLSDTNIDIDEIRESSDFIFDFIVKKLKSIVLESKNTPSIQEHIDLGINVIVAHAFIECIIMENPNDDS